MQRALQGCAEEREKEALDLKKDGEALVKDSLTGITDPRDKLSGGIALLKLSQDQRDKAGPGDAADVQLELIEYETGLVKRTSRCLRFAFKYPDRARQYLVKLETRLKVLNNPPR